MTGSVGRRAPTDHADFLVSFARRAPNCGMSQLNLTLSRLTTLHVDSVLACLSDNETGTDFRCRGDEARQRYVRKHGNILPKMLVSANGCRRRF
jgi:hypothetical protein